MKNGQLQGQPFAGFPVFRVLMFSTHRSLGSARPAFAVPRGSHRAYTTSSGRSRCARVSAPSVTMPGRRNAQAQRLLRSGLAYLHNYTWRIEAARSRFTGRSASIARLTRAQAEAEFTAADHRVTRRSRRGTGRRSRRPAPEAARERGRPPVKASRRRPRATDGRFL